MTVFCNLEKKTLIEMYQKMFQIRQFEEESIQLYRMGSITGYFHPYIGEEAIAVGTCFALNNDDYIVSTHRGHGHCIAKGGSMKKMMAELFAKETGYCRGRGGSMHIANFEMGNLGSNGIVGGGIPLAVGAALGIMQKRTQQVAVSFFSDGAVNNGVFHESLNLASIWNLPVLFVLENNLYAVSTPISQTCLLKDLAKRADSYGIPGVVVDGNDVIEVYVKVKEAVENARNGEGPTLIEAKTYRHTGHHVNDPGLYRPEQEVKSWISKDPISRFKKSLVENKKITEKELDQVEQDVEIIIKEAIEFAKQSPEPSVEEFLKEIKQ